MVLGGQSAGSPLLPLDVSTVYNYKNVRKHVYHVYFTVDMKRKGSGFFEEPTPKKSKTIVKQQRHSKKVSQQLGSILGIEKKFLDSSGSVTVASPTDCTGGEADPVTLNCLNGIAQGDGESNRDGKNYIIKGITFDGIVYRSVVTGAATPSATQSTWTTVAIVLDTQTNGTQLNSEDVYTNPSANANGNADLLRNLQYSKRFKVLKKWIVMDNTGPNFDYNGATYDIGGTAHNLSFYADNLDIRVTCNATTNTVAAIVDNSLHVVAFTNGVNTVSLRYNSRIRFVG